MATTILDYCESAQKSLYRTDDKIIAIMRALMAKVKLNDDFNAMLKDEGELSELFRCLAKSIDNAKLDLANAIRMLVNTN